MDLELTLCERQVRTDPGDREAWARLARAYWHSGRLVESYLVCWRARVPAPPEIERSLAARQREVLSRFSRVSRRRFTVATSHEVEQPWLPGEWEMGWPNIDDILARNRPLPVLGLRVAWARVADTDLRRIGELDTLVRLEFQDRLTDKALRNGFARLAGLEALSHVSVSGRHGLLQDRTLAALADLRSLSELRLLHCNGSGLTSAALAPLRGTRTLTHLDLSGDDVTDDWLQVVGTLSCLKRLSLAGCSRLTGSGLRSIARLSSLTELSLAACSLDDGDLAVVEGLTELSHLDLGASRLTGAVLERLSALAALTHLQVSSCTLLTDAALAALERLPALTHLDLSRCRSVTGEALRVPPSLGCLNLSYSGLSDVGLEHLDLRAVSVLDLSGCRVTDKGLVHLTRSKRLRSLDLTNCHGITDRGLLSLADVPSLAEIKLDYCRHLTERGSRKLLEAAPRLERPESWNRHWPRWV